MSKVSDISTSVKIKRVLKRFVPIKVVTFRKKVIRKFNRATYNEKNGGEFVCPVCERRIKHFVKGTVICPYCGVNDRSRILCDYLKKNGVKRDGKNILFTPFAETMWFKRNNINYLESEYPENGKDLCLDVTNMDLPDESVDLFWISHVLEHVPDDEKALKEIKRALKPDGVAYICVPEIDEDKSIGDDPNDTLRDRETKYGSVEHFRLYGRDFIEKLRKHFNVKIVNIFDYETSEHFSPGVEHCDVESTNFYVCTK